MGNCPFIRGSGCLIVINSSTKFLLLQNIKLIMFYFLPSRLSSELRLLYSSLLPPQHPPLSLPSLFISIQLDFHFPLLLSQFMRVSTRVGLLLILNTFQTDSTSFVQLEWMNECFVTNQVAVYIIREYYF